MVVRSHMDYFKRSVSAPSRDVGHTQKVDVRTHGEDHVIELTVMVILRWRANRGDAMNIMTSLQGIGRDRRIWLLTERKGQIRKCRDHTKLIAVAGLDRAIYQSGTYERAWQQGRTASPRVGRDT